MGSGRVFPRLLRFSIICALRPIILSRKNLSFVELQSAAPLTTSNSYFGEAYSRRHERKSSLLGYLITQEQRSCERCIRQEKSVSNRRFRYNYQNL